MLACHTLLLLLCSVSSSLPLRSINTCFSSAFCSSFIFSTAEAQQESTDRLFVTLSTSDRKQLQHLKLLPISVKEVGLHIGVKNWRSLWDESCNISKEPNTSGCPFIVIINTLIDTLISDDSVSVMSFLASFHRLETKMDAALYMYFL